MARIVRLKDIYDPRFFKNGNPVLDRRLCDTDLFRNIGIIQKLSGSCSDSRQKSCKGNLVPDFDLIPDVSFEIGAHIGRIEVHPLPFGNIQLGV